MRANAGLTLLELLAVLLIGGIVLTIGVPSLERFVLASRRTADVNAFVTAVQLARSTAAKRTRPAVLCHTLDGIACAAAPVGYEQGWMVFVDEDDDRPPVLDAGEQRLFWYTPVTVGTIRSNRTRFVFRPFWRRSTNGTVTFCDRRGALAAQAVIVSPTGRPRIAETGPSRRLTCAAASR